ncbi:MAG: M64 family metallopeptidase [Pirellulales bacterium]
MATRNRCLRLQSFAALVVGLIGPLVAICPSASAVWSTLINNGSPANRVDVVFLGDGYTQANLDAGLYTGHVQNYLGHMFAAPNFLADPFPRYSKFFNVHKIDVVSLESGADDPSQSVFRTTALDATYDTFGIDRLLSINESKANTILNDNLAGSGITADIRLVTVNDVQYGGSGGTWAVFAGGNSEARDIALHELSHAFSATEDEYVTNSGPFLGPEPVAVNVTKDPTGLKWSRWLGFDDPRAPYLDIGAFEGAANYPTGIYRPSLDSKMRTLERPFNAVVREKSILDVYQHVDPLDAWLGNGATIAGGELWVDAVDPNVIWVDWYVNNQLVAANHGESFDLADFDFGAGTYNVRAHAYDEVVKHAFDGTLLDLVRLNLGALQQDVVWTVDFNPPLAGDYNLNGEVDAADYSVWKSSFGSSGQLAADGNDDGFVNAADYTVWRNNVGVGTGGANAANVPIPEPTAAGLFTTALIAGRLLVGARRAARGAVFSDCCRV